LKVVDLPQPEGPRSATRLPASALKLTPSSAMLVPQLFLTPLSSTLANDDLLSVSSLPQREALVRRVQIRNSTECQTVGCSGLDVEQWQLIRLARDQHLG